jgi:hypothetical protein
MLWSFPTPTSLAWPAEKNGQTPYHGDLQLNVQSAHIPFADFETLQYALENYDETKAPVAFAELTNLLMQWRWKAKTEKIKKEVTVPLIAALAVASFIQSTFTFRPMVCIVGVSNSGKSQFQEKVLINLFGHLSKYRKKPSEAAIRQLAQNQSNVIQIDELEKSKYRQHILDLLRTSTDGGIISRGTSNGKEQQFGMKHIVWISSIEMNLASLADASRFFQFETQYPERIDGKRPQLQINKQRIKQIGFDLMVFAIKNMRSLLQTVEELSAADIENASPRNIEAAAVPAAIIEKLSGWTRRETTTFMFFAIRNNTPLETTDVTEEHDELLQAILNQPIRTNIGEMSVRQAVKQVASVMPTETEKQAITITLEMSGIRLVKLHNSEKEVFFHPIIVRDILLKNSDWKNTNIKQLLLRVKGAKEKIPRFSGKSAKGISIPFENIIDSNDQVDDKDESEQAF